MIFRSWPSKLKSKSFLVKLLVYGFIMLLPFFVFHWQSPFLGNQSIGNDYPVFNRYQMELQYCLQHGSFPLYVPGFAGGQTSAALTMGQVYHPISHLASFLPGYWQGKSLECNTFLRLLSLGLVHLGLFILLGRLRLNPILSFIISFITVYNLRMLDLFRYYASLENYTGYLFLCMAMAKSNDCDRLLLKESSFNRVLFSVDAGAPGFFALSYPYSGKWTAQIDGKRVRVHRANGYMHAVYLDAGQHDIEFRYWSQAVFVGMLTSCLTFIFLGIYFAICVFKKKRKQQISLLITSLLVSPGLFWGWYISLYSSDNLETRYT